jgi:outer membrane biosynthesis protein TonB
MSYDSKLNNNRSSQLISSTQIAIAISFLLHFLLFKYGFPILSLSDKTAQGKLNVPIIELSPQEQSRLPDLSPIPDIPEVNTYFPPSQSPLFGLPQSFPIDPSQFPDLPPIPLPPPPPEFTLPPFPSFPSGDINLPPLEDTSVPLPPPPTQGDGVKKPENPVAATKPQPVKPVETKPIVKNPQPSTPTTPKLSPQQIAAVRQQKLNQGVRQLGQSLQKKDNNSTNEEARKNYVSWVNQVKNAKPENLVIQGIYPRDACIRRLEGKSFYGVLVNAQGQVIDLQLLKSATYPIFNIQASKDINSRSFANKTGKPKPYQVEVDFKYNAQICPSLTLPSLLREEKPKSDTPETPKTPNPKPVEPESPKPEVPPKQETPSPANPEIKPEVPPKQETPSPANPEIKPEVPPKQETPSPANPEIKPEVPPKQETPSPANPEVKPKPNSNS